MTTATPVSPAPVATPKAAPKVRKDRTVDPTPAKSPDRAAYDAAIAEASALLSARATRTGSAVAALRADARRMTRAASLIETISAADPTWSRRCSDGKDRNPAALADYLVGIRIDGKARTADLRAWGSAFKSE